jgi:hypothetical protein
MRAALSTVLAILVLTVPSAWAADEGTRHITGEGVDVYFMNDKVFGTADGHPLWAIYNCGTDITGEMDLGDAVYESFAFTYHSEGDRKITGSFGDREMSLGAIDKADEGFVYHVFVGDQEHLFRIHYEKLESEHLVNSIIEGDLGKGETLHLEVDGQLCPFGTTGIILIAAGAALAG